MGWSVKDEMRPLKEGQDFVVWIAARHASRMGAPSASLKVQIDTMFQSKGSMHFSACLLALVLTYPANSGLAADLRAEPKITKDQARAIALAGHQGTVKSS
jgi:hypothetical protein